MLAQNIPLHPHLPSMRCVGYRQVWEVQDGLAPRRELRERGIYATRQLASEQRPWIRQHAAAADRRLPEPRSGRSGQPDHRQHLRLTAKIGQALLESAQAPVQVSAARFACFNSISQRSMTRATQAGVSYRAPVATAEKRLWHARRDGHPPARFISRRDTSGSPSMGSKTPAPRTSTR